MRRLLPLVAPALALLPAPAEAREVFVGVLAHGVGSPLTKPIGEHGADVQIGVRGDPIVRFGIASISPYVLGSIHTEGTTSFVSGGLALKFDLPGRIFFRPALGVAVHTGPGYRAGADDFRTDLGSRVLLQPEIGIGFQVLPRLSAEFQWTHLSHARIFSNQNPGLDMVGTRLTLKL